MGYWLQSLFKVAGEMILKKGIVVLKGFRVQAATFYGEALPHSP